MNSKYKMLFFLFLISPSAFSQEWAQIGTKWYYDSMDNGESPPSSSYYLYESINDTIITGIICKRIEITFFSAKYGIVNKSPEYMYSDSGKVYYFWNNDFKLLYDFSANTGDTIQVFNRLIPDTNPNNITDFRVDSTKLFKDVFLSSTFYGMDSLKVQYIRPVSTHGYNLSFGFNVIVESIGSLDLMFPTPSASIPEKDGPLRCFQEDSIWFKWSSFACDFWVTSVDDLSNNYANDIYTYPNPSKGLFTLEINNNIKSDVEVRVYNLFGKLVYLETLTNLSGIIKQQIDISSFSKGIYIVQVMAGDGIMSKKVVYR